jgi:hypothetical protein
MCSLELTRSSGTSELVVKIMGIVALRFAAQDFGTTGQIQEVSEIDYSE